MRFVLEMTEKERDAIKNVQAAARKNIKNAKRNIQNSIKAIKDSFEVRIVKHKRRNKNGR